MARGSHPPRIIRPTPPCCQNQEQATCLLNNGNWVCRSGASSSITFSPSSAGCHSRERDLCCTAAASKHVGGRRRGRGAGGVTNERHYESRGRKRHNTSGYSVSLTSAHCFNCVWPENISVSAGRSGGRAGVNVGGSGASSLSAASELCKYQVTWRV